MQKHRLVEDPDYPDYTSGVSIDAVTIDTLPVDISARTIESLKIDVIGEITKKVDIHVKTVESGVTFYVDAAAGATFDVNIKDATGVTFNVDIVDATGVTFNVNITDAVTLNVNITDAVTLNVNIKDAAGVTFNVDIVDATGVTFDVNITGSVTIDVNITGSVTLDVNITGAVTLNVNIAAQTVDINIKTSGGANIVIDKLTVGAYTERRSTISNNGAVALWLNSVGVVRQGKFFPRGCRGFLRAVDVYCKDAGATGGTITVWISPHPSMGYVATADVTVPAGGAAAWRGATFNRMWNYDSLFVWLQSSTADMKFGYDAGTPEDRYDSIDSGATWRTATYRLWIRVIFSGETVGDVPVSGTINTIEIPTQSQTRLYATNTNLPLTETTLKEIYGAGFSEYILFRVEPKTDSHKTVFRIYCDDNLAFYWDFFTLHLYGCGASTPGISITLYGTDIACVCLLTLKFTFKRHLKITMNSAITTGQSVTVEGLANLIT